MDLKLGADWIQKLSGKLVEINESRQAEIEKINKVLAIDPYDLADLYVEPNFQTYNPANAEADDIDDEDVDFMTPSHVWLSKFIQRKGARDGRHVAFVLSDAGMGKTSLLAMLAMTAATEFWPHGTSFELRKLGEDSLAEIRSVAQPSKTVLLLDSLDEDKIAYGRIEERIVDILKATQHFRKVIITCRTQFFPEGNRFQRDGGRIKISGFTCKVIYLSLFSESQVAQYLDKVFRGRIDEKLRAKSLVPEMKSLRMRPMLLAHIEDLIDRNPQGGRWNEYRMHEALVDAWLDREERKGTAIAEELRLGCWAIALHLQKTRDLTISPGDLEDLLLEEDTPAGIQRVEDFGGRSLLNKNSDGEYRFAHYSVQEFLVVQRFIVRPDEARVQSLEIRWSDELISFLAAWMLEDPSNRLMGDLASALRKTDSWKRFVEADLSGVDLKGIDLNSANLQRINMAGANLSRAVLEDADLRHARLVNANFEACNLCSANLLGAELCGATLYEADLRRTDLRRANLRDADLRGANFLGSGLQEADLQGADLRGANLREADLGGADMQGANLEGAYLQGAWLPGANLTEASLQGTDLEGVDLQGAYLPGANLQEAKLQGAKLRETNLRGADLRGADLQGADLRGAYLQEANLEETYLEGADLFGAFLEGANLEDADSWGAKGLFKNNFNDD